ARWSAGSSGAWSPRRARTTRPRPGRARRPRRATSGVGDARGQVTQWSILGPVVEGKQITMPTYQYHCTSCGRALEVVQKFTDASLTECPECSGQLKKVFNAVG